MTGSLLRTESMNRRVRAGYFAYNPGINPYQSLFANAVESAGVGVVRLAPGKIRPISRALGSQIDLLHMDWPDDLYMGRNWLTKTVKRAMYRADLQKLREFPFIWTAHDIVPHDAKSRDDQIAQLQMLVDCCDAVIVLSHASRRDFLAAYRVRESVPVEMIPHGHYIDVYPNVIDRSEARRQLMIPGNARVVLSLGRLCPYKGLESLIADFGQLAKAGDVLLIAGMPHSANYVASLVGQAESQGRPDVRIVIEPRPVPADRLQVYYNACDVVAMPFKAISNSGGLLLAMSFGRPVVAPRLGSIPEVAYGPSYFGYEPGNEQGLRDALATALGVDDLLKRGAESREFARSHYDWGRIGQRVRDVYEGVLASPH